MSDLAAYERKQQQNELQAAAAWWYACGYNDHRQPETGRNQPYANPERFAAYWVTLNGQPSRPSLQDAFKAFLIEEIPT